MNSSSFQSSLIRGHPPRLSSRFFKGVKPTAWDLLDKNKNKNGIFFNFWKFLYENKDFSSITTDIHPRLRLFAMPNIISPQLNLRLSRICKRSWPACTVSDQIQRYFPPAVSGSSNEKITNSSGQKLGKWYPRFALLSLPALAICLGFQWKWCSAPCILGSQPCRRTLHRQRCRSRCKDRLKDPFLLSPLGQLSHIPETIIPWKFVFSNFLPLSDTPPLL